MAGFIITTVVLSFVTIIMITIGIIQLKSDHPVGFYTGQRELADDEVTDINAWNRKHGLMWIIYGIVIPCSYLVGFLINQKIISTVILLLVVIGGILVMMAYHHYLESRYLKVKRYKLK